MLMEFIKIENWRSFYGENDIEVSKDPQKNVTLVRAENGVGKTSLLAAINWCLFGILPAESEFENPKKLVNDYAMEKDGVSQTSVQIDFKHEAKRYRAVRSYNQKTEVASGLRLSELVDGGEIPSSKAQPDRFINSVIPREMAPHFFFYGEATSRYTGSTGAKKFGAAVKGILGSTVARMALEDLKKVTQEYNKQASDNTSQEAQHAQRDIEKAEEQLAAARERVKKFDSEIDAADARIDKLNQELAGTQPAKEKQALRTKLESRLSGLESERTKAELRAQSWMHSYATAILSEELVMEASNAINAEETRGKIPAPYDQKIVNEILEDGVCICGTHVIKGSKEFVAIMALLNTAGDQTVMSRVISTNAALGRLQEKAKVAWSTYERNQIDLKKIESEIRRLEADIHEISKELSANPITDIAEREAARERAKAQRSEAHRRKGEAQSAISAYERQRDACVARRDELVLKSNAARRFVKRAQLAAALTDRLSSRLSHEEEAARDAIERDIDAIVQKFLRKPASVKLDRDYQLRLYDDRGIESAKSTGENQLLGLAFTGAIAKYAKEREGRMDDILLPGTVAPLVVDSPFGHLDPLYRQGVADFLPHLASQVILLVSTSQASETVMAKLADKIGEEYVLTRHNVTDGANKLEEVVVIRGGTHRLTQYNSEFNGTKISWVRP